MSENRDGLDQRVEKASEKISRTWPLYSYVTSNPLSGFEDEPFRTGVSRARGLLGGRGYPTARHFRLAWENGQIDPDILNQKLDASGITGSGEVLLDRLESSEHPIANDKSLGPAERTLNQVLEKWLSSFLDEGQSRWSMPHREKGFYGAWIELARVDHHIPSPERLTDFPDDKHEAIEYVLRDVSPTEYDRVFLYHLSALPGWVGYIQQRRSRSRDQWAEKYPMDLVDYLAVRLVLADLLGATIVPDRAVTDPRTDELDDLRHCFLEAWEETYRQDLIDGLNTETLELSDRPKDPPEIQMVFCIDIRSEIIRRHIESTGSYETHGYAGFFGVPVRYREHGTSTSIENCPPIVDPEHEIGDRIRDDAPEEARSLFDWDNLKEKTKSGLRNIKDDVVSAFSYVEFTGLFYGLMMLGKTLLPVPTDSALQQYERSLPDYHDVTEPDLHGLNLEDKIQYAQAAFDLMGWTEFAPLVVFVGHTSQTSNNPFDSSLKCGACSGNSGVPNARMLAAICNEESVRKALNRRGFEIPEETVFLPARHNTTTDEIELFDSAVDVPHTEQVKELKANLQTARVKATRERMEEMPDVTTGEGPSESVKRARDWAQTRPEWGLSGNASFIVGPNRLRKGVDLEGRAFLHTYHWKTDPDGSALESIFAGPVVVCQWINHQYYFSSIDNRVYGSGSKITHNPVGNFGVLQGNGGDLMGGLPFQSLMKSDTELHHPPLRLLTVVHAPLARVNDVLEEHDAIARLIENDWMALEVIDPTRNNETLRIGEEEASRREPVLA